MPASFQNTIREFITANRLWTKDHRLLVAVSGGRDSMSLLHFLFHEGYPMLVAHVNHGLRGVASDAESDLVAATCVQLGLQYFVLRADTREVMEKEGRSLEDAARVIRYRYFRQLCADHHCHRIITAHHIDDNLETTLLFLTRGTGIHGFSGIQPLNGNIARPFLAVTRNEVAEYASAHQIAFLEDESNTDKRFMRNKIRHEVIPTLLNINPALHETFKSTAQNLREAAQLSEIAVEKALRKMVHIREKETYVHKAALLQHPARRTLLHYLLQDGGFTRSQQDDILHGLSGQALYFEGSRQRLWIDRKHIVLAPAQEVANRAIWHAGEKSVYWMDFKMTMEKYTATRVHAVSDSDTILVDASRLQFPLEIRPRAQGDYFYPLGLYKSSGQPGKKKVSDLLTDKKLHHFQKERVWVLVSGQQIVWVIGIRQDERFKVKENTRDILKIKVLPIKRSTFY
ncbi:MAG TPA: tRNA lysidine(34) synthetase TilS [Bacteroidetes bacterium]|nr:tRNA lysidine(34) synthetase TilS [Bacteroidota bacterium]